MTKQASKMCFFGLILLSSLNHICYSKAEENQTVSGDSAPESNQEILSPGNLSLPSVDGAPILELEDQSLSPDQYANDAAPGIVEEPNFFAPELYFPSPFPEALATKPEANDHNSQISTPATSPPDFALLEKKEVSAEPDATNNSEIQAEETKAVSPEPETVDYKSLLKPSATAPSTEPEVWPEADANDTSAIKSSGPAPSMAIQLPEMHAESPASLPSNFPGSYTAEEATTLRKADSESSQEAPSSEDTDTLVDMPTIINNPSVLPSNYSAEDETVDIVHEEEDSTRESWKIGENNLVMGGVVAGVCFVSLAGLACNSSKNKKKTQFQYQSLHKRSLV